MSTFKRTKVVMLPTKEVIKNHVFKMVKPNTPIFVNGQIGIFNNYKLVKCHLFFLSDDEIKEGHWVYDIITKQISKAATYESETTTIIRKQTKKIIATTDKSLMVDATYFDYRTQTVEKCKRTLAEPSQGFIKKYCEKGGIDEVMVEYEDNGSEEWYGDDMEGEPVWREQWQPRVASDNTITIKPIKDSWSREEVESITYKAISEFLNRARKQYGYLVPFGFRATAFTFKGSELKDYLKENL